MTLVRTAGLLLVSAASTLACAGCRGHAAVPSSASATVPPGGGIAAAGGNAGAGAGAGIAVPGDGYAAGAAGQALTAADLLAYRRGREKELVLMHAALERLRRADGDRGARQAAVRTAAEAEVERAGAAAAGLTPERYRALVARVDSVLLERAREETDSAKGSASGAGSADDWRLLDSLRVELAVLRSRFGASAEAGGTP
jgi:hypothetical protein